ncbi:MAG: hypothetical protein IAE91_07175 [Ignavibacteriaceae bacterium]|nr:hypothetical protein [Ignavibacteriaceae bacterium]
MEELKQLNFKQLLKMGLVNEVELRNYLINMRFSELQKTGMKTKVIEEILGEEFFISPESVHRIRYSKKHKMITKLGFE